MEESKSNAPKNGLKLLGESLLPGSSLMMEGQIVKGGAHTIASTLVRVVLGPFGVALVAANSYAHSVTGKGLLAQLKELRPAKSAAEPAPAEAAAAEAAAP